MITPIDKTKFTDNALRKLGLLPPLPPTKLGVGTVVAVSVNDDKPLYVRGENGAVFAMGGLTPLQQQQIPHLLPELIGIKVFYKYEHENDVGQATDSVFQTLLIENDTSPRATALNDKLQAMEGGAS